MSRSYDPLQKIFGNSTKRSTFSMECTPMDKGWSWQIWETCIPPKWDGNVANLTSCRLNWTWWGFCLWMWGCPWRTTMCGAWRWWCIISRLDWMNYHNPGPLTDGFHLSGFASSVALGSSDWSDLLRSNCLRLLWCPIPIFKRGVVLWTFSWELIGTKQNT